jgi:uncharacterized integral membrane protein (TIGR00697 family)
MSRRTDSEVETALAALDTRSRLYVALTTTFVTCLVVGDIIGGKLVETTIAGYPFTITVGMIPFPVTFLLTDLLNEFYGQRAARFATWVGLCMALLSYAVIFVAAWLPIADLTRSPRWLGVNEQAFQRVFMSSQRMILASLTAYVIAQLVDISVFHMLKRGTGNRFLWLRATGSTVVSQLIDTLTVSLVAWTGLLDARHIVVIIVSSYVMKLLIAIGLTPLVYAGHAFIERVFKLEPVAVPSRVAALGDELGTRGA